MRSLIVHPAARQTNAASANVNKRPRCFGPVEEPVFACANAKSHQRIGKYVASHGPGEPDGTSFGFREREVELAFYADTSSLQEIRARAEDPGRNAELPGDRLSELAPRGL